MAESTRQITRTAAGLLLPGAALFATLHLRDCSLLAKVTTASTAALLLVGAAHDPAGFGVGIALLPSALHGAWKSAPWLSKAAFGANALVGCVAAFLFVGATWEASRLNSKSGHDRSDKINKLILIASRTLLPVALLSSRHSPVGLGWTSWIAFGVSLWRGSDVELRAPAAGIALAAILQGDHRMAVLPICAALATLYESRGSS